MRGEGRVSFESWGHSIVCVSFAMEPWTVEHRVFAYDCFVLNNELVTVVQLEFRRHFNIHRNRAVPSQNTILRWVESLRRRGELTNSSAKTKRSSANSSNSWKCGHRSTSLSSQSDSICSATCCCTSPQWPLGKAYFAYGSPLLPIQIGHCATVKARWFCTAN